MNSSGSSPGGGVSVEVAGARRRFPSRRATSPVLALDGVDLSVEPGELLVVMGPSGAGKSTLLRAVAGLERLDAGRVVVDGEDVTDAPPAWRDVAMVFQEPALYPHLSVEANVAFGLRARRLGAAEVQARVDSAAEALDLRPLQRGRPRELSGGERQRVGLARALVRKPRAFLMDEPLSSLDGELRTRARAQIKALQAQLGTTTIYVTHDSSEAMVLGRRVAVLRAGRVEQVGTPLELFDRPRNAFVARSVGPLPMNVVPARVLPAPDGKPWAGIRPERLTLLEIAAAGPGDLRGEVVAVEVAGADAVVHVRVDDVTLLARVPRDGRAWSEGSVVLSYSGSDVYGFDEGP